MALDYLRDVKPLEDLGQTDAQIAAAYSPQTETDLPTNLLRRYFHNNDLWLIDPATGLRLAGTIGEAYSGLNNAQKELLRKLENWTYNQDSIETENDLAIAAEFEQIVNGMVTLGILTSQQRAAIAAMAGGLRHGTLTAQDVADCRAAYQAEQQAAADRQARTDAYNAIRNRAQAAIDAAQAARTAEQTPAEITAAGEAAFAV